MGLTATDIDLLLELRQRNLSISLIATIGSLSLYLHPRQATRLQKIIPESRALAKYRWGDTADPILCELTGATEVVSIDMSDYQGSSIVLDKMMPLSNPPSSGLDVQRSDYVTAWNSSPKTKRQSGPKAALRKIFHRLPRTLQSRISDIVTRNMLGNPRTMRRWRGAIE